MTSSAARIFTARSLIPKVNESKYTNIPETPGWRPVWLITQFKLAVDVAGYSQDVSSSPLSGRNNFFIAMKLISTSLRPPSITPRGNLGSI